jgi:hypothetical protein
MPFPIAALQVDGGSEFDAEFELVCQHRGLPLFVLPPRSPKLNGRVERSHRTHHDEFYQVIPDHWDVRSLNPQLRRWEQIYNTVRPHQALAISRRSNFSSAVNLNQRRPSVTNHVDEYDGKNSEISPAMMAGSCSNQPKRSVFKGPGRKCNLTRSQPLRHAPLMEESDGPVLCCCFWGAQYSRCSFNSLSRSYSG